MNARAAVTELAAKIRGPTGAGSRPLEYNMSSEGAGSLAKHIAEVVFKFEDIHLVGKSEPKDTKDAAREDACAAIREQIQGIWDQRSSQMAPKLRIPCPLCQELLRPHSMGEHLMIFHSEKVIEDAGKTGDIAYQRTVSDAIARIQVDQAL